MACSHLTGTLTGRLPLRRFFQQNRPVSAGRDRACAGQVECKGLVSWNAIDWSVVVQIEADAAMLIAAGVIDRR